MKEMIGGCCVCSDEQGWADNPLVYCDGKGCNVAVHQACYGIEFVPSGSWFCKKCDYKGDKSKVLCKLCPNEDGALKRTDTKDWAHVICALYIPEVEFGDVKTMEPIIISKIPKDRYNKVCYICENKESKNKIVGACMSCHKFDCPNDFHVTCGQRAGLLCEKRSTKPKEANIIKYTGFCSFHYKKEFKPSQFLAVPAYIPPSVKDIEGILGHTYIGNFKLSYPLNSVSMSSKLNSTQILSSGVGYSYSTSSYIPAKASSNIGDNSNELFGSPHLLITSEKKPSLINFKLSDIPISTSINTSQTEFIKKFEKFFPSPETVNMVGNTALSTPNSMLLALQSTSQPVISTSSCLISPIHSMQHHHAQAASEQSWSLSKFILSASTASTTNASPTTTCGFLGGIGSSISSNSNNVQLVLPTTVSPTFNNHIYYSNFGNSNAHTTTMNTSNNLIVKKEEVHIGGYNKGLDTNAVPNFMQGDSTLTLTTSLKPVVSSGLSENVKEFNSRTTKASASKEGKNKINPKEASGNKISKTIKANSPEKLKQSPVKETSTSTGNKKKKEKHIPASLSLPAKEIASKKLATNLGNNKPTTSSFNVSMDFSFVEQTFESRNKPTPILDSLPLKTDPFKANLYNTASSRTSPEKSKALNINQMPQNQTLRTSNLNDAPLEFGYGEPRDTIDNQILQSLPQIPDEVDLEYLDNFMNSEPIKGAYEQFLPSEVLSELNTYRALKTDYEKMQNQMKNITLEYSILKALYNSLL